MNPDFSICDTERNFQYFLVPYVLNQVHLCEAEKDIAIFFARLISKWHFYLILEDKGPVYRNFSRRQLVVCELGVASVQGVAASGLAEAPVEPLECAGVWCIAPF